MPDREVGQQFDPDQEYFEFMGLGGDAGLGLGDLGLEVHDGLVALGDEVPEVGDLLLDRRDLLLDRPDLLLDRPDLLLDRPDLGFLGSDLVLQRGDRPVVRTCAGHVGGRQRTEGDAEGRDEESTGRVGMHGAERRGRPSSKGGTSRIYRSFSVPDRSGSRCWSAGRGPCS